MRPPRNYRHLTHHNGMVRLHLHTSIHLWTEKNDRTYRHYDVAHNLTRWQAFRLGARLIWKAVSRAR